MSNASVNLALEKISNKDRDHRYMGTSDLLSEIQKDSLKMDTELERKLCQAVLLLLDDSSGDISGLAVKCLATLVKKVAEYRVEEICSSLVRKLINGKDAQRDIASIALKTVVAEISSNAVASKVISTMPKKLMEGVTSQTSSLEVKGQCLDLLCDTLQRFGGIMAADHEEVLLSALGQLNAQRASLRKKAIQCLSSLAPHMTDDLLNKAMATLVDLLKSKDSNADKTRTNIQLVGSICRAVGPRFSPYLPDVVPLLIGYCREAQESDDEVRENSLQALETFVLRCPRDISPFCSSILSLALDYVSYDPNYNDDMDEDGDDDDDDDLAVDDEDDESVEDFSDDEDVSWKVRRAAAKCLSAITVSRPELLPVLYTQVSPKLIERFKEREENVKIDVFVAFIDLLKQTAASSMQGRYYSADSSSPTAVLQQLLPRVVKSLNKQLREKSVKTRVGVFSVLRELVVVLHGCLASHVASLVPGIVKALNDKSSTSNLKIEALLFTRLTMASHSPTVFQPFIKEILPPVLGAVEERYYKVTGEALRLCGEIVNVIRPQGGQLSKFDFSPFVQPLYCSVSKRLTAQDQDQEVKECAITCMGLVVSTLGDRLQPELATCLPLLLDRLRNEITRLTAVKAFATIAESPLGIDLSIVLEPVVGELTKFLRKANRPLRQSTLVALNCLVRAQGSKVPGSSYRAIVADLPPLISDADLALTALSLDLCCTLLQQQQQPSQGSSAANSTVTAVQQLVLPQALVLVRSSLLQGHALQSLQRFFGVMVQSGGGSSFDSLLAALLDSHGGYTTSPPPNRPISSPSSSSASYPAASSAASVRQSFSSISQCVAVLCGAAGEQKCGQTVGSLVGNVTGGPGRATGDGLRLFSLLCLGEIGRRMDLSLLPSSASIPVESAILHCLQSPLQSEEVKAAASYALGSMAIGNTAKYLPFIIAAINEQPKGLQYPLLLALKEVIGVQLSGPQVDSIVGLLFSHVASSEEGVRNVVAECLGKQALLEPAAVLPALKAGTESDSAYSRTTMAMALKFIIVDEPQPIDSYIKPIMSSFLMLSDSDRHVRKASVVALSTAVHNKPSLVEDLLPDLLPQLYQQMEVKKELIRTVDLGPFKHTVDDGLELRKAAFNCMDTLLNNCLHKIDPKTFITPYLLSGLGDNYDVKMPCHLILSKLAEKCSAAVLAVIDSLVDPLEKTVTSKVKQDAVKQEVDRNEDLIKSALRAVISLSKIPKVEHSTRFKNFLNNVVKVGPVGVLYIQVGQEHESIAAAAIADTGL